MGVTLSEQVGHLVGDAAVRMDKATVVEIVVV
jgi:hypothetical protein